MVVFLFQGYKSSRSGLLPIGPMERHTRLSAIHSGPKLAGHLTAPNQCCSNVKKALAKAMGSSERNVNDGGSDYRFAECGKCD